MSFILQGASDRRWREVSQYIAKFKPLSCSRSCQVCRSGGIHEVVTLIQSLKSIFVGQDAIEQLEKEVQQLEDREREVLGGFDNEVDAINARYTSELGHYNAMHAEASAYVDEWISEYTLKKGDPEFLDPRRDAEQTLKVREGLRRGRAWITENDAWFRPGIESRRDEQLANVGVLSRQIDELYHSINDTQLTIDKSQQLIDRDIAWFKGQQLLDPDKIPVHLQLNEAGTDFRSYLHRRN